MGRTGISWTDEVWNCVRGCSRVSAGCQHCYAEVQAARIVRMGKGKPTAYDGLVKLVGADREPRWTGVVRLVSEQLAWPLRKRKPLRIFVNSMSDLFHESLTNEQIAAVFGVMAACPQHTFQVLTKRAKRMREWFEWVAIEAGHARDAAIVYYEDTRDMEVRMCVAWADTHHLDRQHVVYPAWPLPNVWLGVSVENQEAADERIPELMRTPAAVRFLSCEPLLGRVFLHAWVSQSEYEHGGPDAKCHCSVCGIEREPGPGRDEEHDCPPGFGAIDWVIAGCESGPGARSCSVEWLRSLRDQCADAGVAFFLKQAVEDSGMRPDDLCDECGERTRYHVAGPRDTLCSCACTVEGPEAADWSPEVGFGDDSKRKPGGVIELPYLDGVQHAAFPNPTQEAPMRAPGQRPAPLRISTRPSAPPRRLPVSDSLVCSEHGHRIPCFDCVKRGLDAIPLTTSGMTADECLALIERDREALRAENARLMGLVGDGMLEVERMRPVVEASIAMRRSESRAALASDVIAEIEAERMLTDAQVEARSQLALTRWRTAVDAIDGKPDAAPPTDYRADAIASHLWLSQAGVPAAKTLVERVKGLVEQRDELTKHLEWERDHSKMLSDSTTRLFVEKAKVEEFCAKVRGEYTEAIRDRDAACRMHETATQHAVDAKARAEYVTKQRDQFAAAIDRLQPLRSVLGDYDWTGAKADGVLPEGAEQKVIDAFAYVEAAEMKAKEGGNG